LNFSPIVISCPPLPLSFPFHYIAMNNGSSARGRGRGDRNNLIRSNYRSINHNTRFWGMDRGRVRSCCCCGVQFVLSAE
jgi:hypothetical protein